MLAVTIGKSSNLELTERLMPIASNREVLIEVHASGVNRADILQRKGYYPVPANAPANVPLDILGLEVAGKIIAANSETLNSFDNPYDLKVGSSVCALLQAGGYAQYCVAPISLCLPVPYGLSYVQAASLPEAFFTVWSNLFDQGRLTDNLDNHNKKTILIHGGASGIGVAAIALAKAFGHSVIVTAGSNIKCQACLDLGANYAINYKEEDFAVKVSLLTKARGVDLILDMVAGSYVAKNLACLAENGCLLLIAFMGGKLSEIDVSQMLVKKLTIKGSSLRSQTLEFKTKIAGQLKTKVWPLLEKHTIDATQPIIRPVIAQTFPLEEAGKAHILMEGGTHIGKIVLEVKNSKYPD